MANDRLYIRCKVCGDLFYIGKNYGGPFYYENYKKLAGDEEAPPLEDLINDFFASHIHSFSGSKKWNGDFELVYEMDDDFVRLEPAYAASMIEWTRCSDKMPDKDGEYLVAGKTCQGGVVTAVDQYFSGLGFFDDFQNDAIAWAEIPKYEV